VNGVLKRVDYLSQSFPVGYTIQRYPPPPNAPASPPAITRLWWGNNIGPTGGTVLPDDPISVNCIVHEADGAPMTVAITVAWDGLAPRTWTKAFPAGASSSEEGAVLDVGFIWPNASRAVVTCLGTNNRGETARATMPIPR